MTKRECSGNHVYRFATFEHAGHRFEQTAVLADVEVGRLQAVADALPRGVVEQQAAKHGLLGFVAVGLWGGWK